MGGDQRYTAVCSHTHLFRGARLRVEGVKDPEGYVAEPKPLALDVQFSDGVGVEGEVVAKSGQVGVGVGGYVTRAGKEMPERVWAVREVRVAGGEVEVVVG